MNYKAPDNSIHVIEQAYSYMLPFGCVEITDEEAELIRQENAPPIQIENVTPRQIRQALNSLGLRSSVEAAVAAGNQDLKDWWEFSTYFGRTHPVVISMGQSLGQSEQDMDDLWELAASL